MAPPAAAGPAVTPDRNPELVTMATLITAAQELVTGDDRRILGVTGAPGAGKSTVGEALVAALAPNAALVSMDGFHLRDDELRRLGRYERKGASDTFDAGGYIHLLRRLRDRAEPVIYAPVFDRALEESIGSATPVPDEVSLIITEGNYLLVDDANWGGVAGLLDACWYVDPGERTRLDRLIARHVTFGRPLAEAVGRSHGSDEDNAAVTAASRHRASWLVQLTHNPDLEPVPPTGTAD